MFPMLVDIHVKSILTIREQTPPTAGRRVDEGVLRGVTLNERRRDRRGDNIWRSIIFVTTWL